MHICTYARMQSRTGAHMHIGSYTHHIGSYTHHIGSYTHHIGSYTHTVSCTYARTLIRTDALTHLRTYAHTHIRTYAHTRTFLLHVAHLLMWGTCRACIQTHEHTCAYKHTNNTQKACNHHSLFITILQHTVTPVYTHHRKKKNSPSRCPRPPETSVT